MLCVGTLLKNNSKHSYRDQIEESYSLMLVKKCNKIVFDKRDLFLIEVFGNSKCRISTLRWSLVLNGCSEKWFAYLKE